MAEFDVDGRVLIGFDDGPLEPDPAWTRIDDLRPNIVTQIQITAGKQSEFDESDTNHAIVFLNDRWGIFDHANPSSDYFGKLDGKQILIQLWDPVNEGWFSRFRGLIDEYAYDLHPATVQGVSILSNIQIVCVGIFDYLAGIGLIPGVMGDIPAPTGSESNVYYGPAEVDARIEQILSDAGIDPTRSVVFSGNVNVQETRYDPEDKALVALRDAADAETYVALANIYEDRFGRFVFHGRQARIDPDTVAAGAGVDVWDFQTFKIGDGAAIAGDPTYAQIREPFLYRVARSKIINNALAWPRGVDRSTIPDLVVTDDPSIASYGFHSQPTYTDNINAGHKTNGDSASQDLYRTSQYLVQNFKDPRIRIDSVTLKSLEPTDPRAAATWPVLCRSDISDKTIVTVGYPSGEGVDEAAFIEGFQQTITPLQPGFDMVELALNVSPATTENTYDDG